MRLGLNRESAELLTERVELRPDDEERRYCFECVFFRDLGMQCRNPRRLTIQAPRDLGEISFMPQRCLGFTNERSDL
jgi:hypothetical protein